MSNRLEQAKQKIQNEVCSVAAVTADGTVFTDSGSSVRPLFRLYTAHKAALRGASVADRIIGKAAASILCDADVKEVFAFLMSETGLALLQANGIAARYAELVPYIENRTGTDLCPMEKIVADCDDLPICVARIATFINENR